VDLYIHFPIRLHFVVFNQLITETILPLPFSFECICIYMDRLCGLVVRVLATDPEARVRFPALPKKKSNGSGTGSTQPREYN
jgi:hypothetical protein